jgi:hypothetical protein
MNGRYRLVRKKAFESLEKFEKRLNEEVGNTWRVVNIATDSGGLIALLERESRH